MFCKQLKHRIKAKGNIIVWPGIYPAKRQCGIPGSARGWQNAPGGVACIKGTPRVHTPLANQVLINERAFNETLNMVGPKRSITTNSATLTALLLAAKQEGWHGGEVFFNNNGNAVKRFSNGIIVNDSKALALGTTLRNLIKKDHSRQTIRV